MAHEAPAFVWVIGSANLSRTPPQRGRSSFNPVRTASGHKTVQGQAVFPPTARPPDRPTARVILVTANPYVPQERPVPIEHHPRRVPTALPRFASGLAADASATTRVAAIVLQVAAFAVVLAALPYPVFELDRYTYPERAGAARRRAGRDAALPGLGAPAHGVRGGRAARWPISACRRVSALLATNGWLAFRALGVSLAGAALFWCARTVARAGRGEAVLVGIGGGGGARCAHGPGPGLRAGGRPTWRA